MGEWKPIHLSKSYRRVVRFRHLGIEHMGSSPHMRLFCLIWVRVSSLVRVPARDRFTYFVGFCSCIVLLLITWAHNLLWAHNLSGFVASEVRASLQ
jgi:hypothetical protein